MKILHICAGWQKWNGAANIARLLMAEQAREGHAVSSASWTTVCALRVADEVWIHCGWLPCLWWAALWGRRVHWMPEGCYDPVRRKYHGWKKWLVGPVERWCLRRCAKIVATCATEKEWIEAYLGKRCPPVEVTDIKRFFDLSHKEQEKQKKREELHLLYLGRRHPLKGLEYLEAAAAELNSKSVHQTLHTRLKIISSAFGEELEKVWEWCDVLVLPTLSENFGLVIAEALERGKRVITTDGAPAWEESLEWRVGEIWSGYEGRLLYLKGYRDGTKEQRIALLKCGIASLVSCLTSK